MPIPNLAPTHPSLHPRIKTRLFWSCCFFLFFLFLSICGDVAEGQTNKTLGWMQLMLPWSCNHLAQTACSSFRSPITSHCEGACVCDINDTKLHSKQHGEGVGADFVFFSITQKRQTSPSLTATHANVLESTMWHSHLMRGKWGGGAWKG